MTPCRGHRGVEVDNPDLYERRWVCSRCLARVVPEGSTWVEVDDEGTRIAPPPPPREPLNLRTVRDWALVACGTGLVGQQIVFADWPSPMLMAVGVALAGMPLTLNHTDL